MAQIQRRGLGQELTKLHIFLAFDPIILFLGIYPDNQYTSNNMSIHMHKAMCFLIVKYYKQPKCPNIREDWLNKPQHSHTVEYYAAGKKKTGELQELL